MLLLASEHSGEFDATRETDDRESADADTVVDARQKTLRITPDGQPRLYIEVQERSQVLVEEERVVKADAVLQRVPALIRVREVIAAQPVIPLDAPLIVGETGGREVGVNRPEDVLLSWI